MRTKLANGYYVYDRRRKDTLNKGPIRHSDAAYWELDATKTLLDDLIVIDQDYNEVSPNGNLITNKD